VNTAASFPTLEMAEERVLHIQTKLHQWSVNDVDRRFCDLYNLVYDPAFLRVAWERVRRNKGARTAGVDAKTATDIERGRGIERFLDELRSELKARQFLPLPARQVMIPKSGGKLRRLGIPVIRDRVVQASLKLVLEPIFEADFQPCSHGFRPKHRAQDAIAEIHFFTSRSYGWIVDADIEACFDNIDHTALMERVRRRVGDKRILSLVKAFLKAGVLSTVGEKEPTTTGTPQGGILSPLLANIALSVLDDHFVDEWNSDMGTLYRRQKRRKHGLHNWRLVRYADDFVIMVAGSEQQAELLRDGIAAVLKPMGLNLSESKTRITHIDKGFEFLGFRIQRKPKNGSTKRHVYTYPSKSALASVKAKIKRETRGGTDRDLATVLHRLNSILRGWTNYFRHGASKATFSYLRAFTWRRVVCWLRHKYHKASWRWLRAHYLVRWWPQDGDVMLMNPGAVTVSRYRFRGHHIPTPWSLESTVVVNH
jgi:RNA-directed DNA polymerase